MMDDKAHGHIFLSLVPDAPMSHKVSFQIQSQEKSVLNLSILQSILSSMINIFWFTGIQIDNFSEKK